MTDIPPLPSVAPKFIQRPGVKFVSYYRKGGYHPVDIGDVFQNRYTVMNKLGYGSSATVWLVEDMHLKRIRSLKVLAADASTEASSEREVVRRLIHAQSSPSSLSFPGSGAEYVMKVFDDFEIEGPNGTHWCVVGEVLGMGIAADLEGIWDEERYPLWAGRRIAAQITYGVAFLHRCGVVHADLHVGNILFYHPQMDEWTPENLPKYLRKPKKCRHTYNDSDHTPVDPAMVPPYLPRYLVYVRGHTELLQLCISSLHVKICDFSKSFLCDPGPKLERRFGIPTLLAAPEIIFYDPATPPGPPADVWSLAALMHGLLSGFLGYYIFNSYYNIKKEVLREIVLGLGKLPQKYWDQWEERSEYFDEDGKFLGDSGVGSPKRLVKCLASRGITEEEEQAFDELVKRMVKYEPGERISADEVVRLLPSSWLEDSGEDSDWDSSEDSGEDSSEDAVV